MSLRPRYSPPAMSLPSGAKLGPHEIQSPLGAGGMGEVHRARDPRLDRTVAIKILPEHLSHSAEAKQRFDREARAISSLSHPNICHLYDVGPAGFHQLPVFLAGFRHCIEPIFDGGMGGTMPCFIGQFSLVHVLHGFLYGRAARRVVQTANPVQPLNRLEDRIRLLSEQLLKAEGEEFEHIAVELRAAINEHIERIRARLRQYPLADDRRSTDDS